jgi:hypothetical protein
LSFAALACAGAASARTITVSLDGTKLVRMPAAAASVSIGNPMVAGIAMDSSRTVFITGRQWGRTNLFVLDSSGHTIMSVPVEVASTDAKVVSVFRGGVNPLSYACANTCERTLTPGDEPAAFEGLNDQIDKRTNRAKDAMKNDD